MTKNEAINTQVFVIEPNEYRNYVQRIGQKEFQRREAIGFEIKETSLYDFIMISADETTSPRGAEMRLHVRENNEKFEVWTWGVRGQNPKFIESFESEDDAGNYIFEKTYEYDFLTDDQRDTRYYDSYDEALEALAEIMNISTDTLKSIQHYENVKKEILEKRKQKQIEAANENKARVEKLAEIYSKMIEKFEGESYKETCKRLSDTINERIESAVFHTAVKLIRNRSIKKEKIKIYTAKNNSAFLSISDFNDNYGAQTEIFTPKNGVDVDRILYKKLYEDNRTKAAHIEMTFEFNSEKEKDEIISNYSSSNLYQINEENNEIELMYSLYFEENN